MLFLYFSFVLFMGFVDFLLLIVAVIEGELKDEEGEDWNCSAGSKDLLEVLLGGVEEGCKVFVDMEAREEGEDRVVGHEG